MCDSTNWYSLVIGIYYWLASCLTLWFQQPLNYNIIFCVDKLEAAMWLLLGGMVVNHENMAKLGSNIISAALMIEWLPHFPI